VADPTEPFVCSVLLYVTGVEQRNQYVDARQIRQRGTSSRIWLTSSGTVPVVCAFGNSGRPLQVLVATEGRCSAVRASCKMTDRHVLAVDARAGEGKHVVIYIEGGTYRGASIDIRSFRTLRIVLFASSIIQDSF